MLCLAVASIFISIILMVSVFYGIFEKQVFEDLKTDANILATAISITDIQEENFADISDHIEGVRITLIDETGIVKYDSVANQSLMDNHISRPEITEALENGEGQSVRESDTLNANTFYYALKMENGYLLRTSKEAHSIWSIYINSSPMFVFVVIGIVVICAWLSRYLTESIVKPIEELGNNMDEIKNIETYEELKPFIQTITNQHEAILKNAMVRQEFTANVTHELKTPLTAISGYSELIETGIATDDDTIRFAAGIHKSANRLLTLINDIIRLSELDVTDTLELEELDLYQLAENTVEMLQLNAEKRNVSLSLQGEKCIFRANRQMMEELLYNLIDNGIRYNNSHGKVVVFVYHEQGHPVLQVVDTGIGIPKEHQNRIFERFYRVDKSRSKETGGTGLGLAIVKHITAVHDAELILNSEPEKGTDVKILFGNTNTAKE